MPARTYVLVPGAGSDAWYWNRVIPYLEAEGHRAIALDLPVDDESAGLADYMAIAEGAIAGHERVTLVAQSMGALTAAALAGRPEVEQLVLVAPMIPAPGETGGDWWANTGQADAARRQAEREGRDPDAPFDPMVVFLHDVPGEVIEESARHVYDQAGRPFADPWPLEKWPDVETRVVAGQHDRFFPLEFVQRVSRERLGIDPEVVDSGHLVALARPGELANLLLV